MDTLNTHIDGSCPIAMGTSEQHSEKTSAASDEDDFNMNIPYFEDADGNKKIFNKTSQQQFHQQQQQQQQQQSQQSSAIGNFDLLNRNQGTSPDIDDSNQLNYTNWDNDDVFTDDNASRFGSDYSAQSTSESPSLYPPHTGQQYYYGDPHEIDIKYPPSELILQPPSRLTSLSFEMHQQQPQAQQQQSVGEAQEQQQTVRRHLQQLAPPHLQHITPALQNRHQHHHPYHHPQYGGANNVGNDGTSTISPSYQNQQPQHVGYHPNMWYPNAPYGSNRYNNYDPNRYACHSNTVYANDPMIEMLQLSNSGREARNRAEKNRRDKLNGSIQELSAMVPHVAESPRRVDKTAVLRFAAHGLRLKHVFGESLQHRAQITDPFMKLLDSFFITLTCHGQIVLISSSIEKHLGHCQADLYGQNILHIAHPDDHSMLKHQLIPTDLENLFETQSEDDSGEPRPRTEEEEKFIDKTLREDKRSFTVRLARSGPRSEPITYEVVRIEGCFRRSDEAPRGVKHNPFPTSLQLIRRSRGRDDSIPLHSISGNDIVLIAIARIIRPPRVTLSITESSLEYKTRHLIDGRIIDCDQRIGLVAGYMTDEVKNLSPFSFMHQDDARWVIVALRQMYDCNSSYGESTYRLLSRNGSFIYLRSRGYLEIDKITNKVHSFVCINTLLDDEEGKRRVEEMKRKFSIIINARIPASSIDAPASENPQQLEKAVMRLIQDLQKSSDDEDDNYENEHENGKNSQLVNVRMAASSNSKAGSNSPSSSRKSTIALVPPEVSSVKSSISKSACVVNATAARQLRSSQRLRSPASTTEDEDDHDTEDIIGTHGYDIKNENASKRLSNCSCGNIVDGFCETCGRYDFLQKIAAANRLNRKHKISESISSEADDEPQHKRSHKNEDIEQILSSPNQSEGSELSEHIHGQNKHPECFKSELQLLEDSPKPQKDILINIETNYEVSTPSRPNIDSRTTKSPTQPTMSKSEQKQR